MVAENLEKKALLGMHHPILIGAYIGGCKVHGYSAKVVKTEQEMLEEAKREKYQVYIMDANLGYPGSRDIAPCLRVYELVKERVEKGEAKFMVISGNNLIVEDVTSKGIPAQLNTSFASSLSEFLG